MKKIISLIAVIILVGLYISSLVLAIIGNRASTGLLMLSIGATIIIPVFLYIYSMMYKYIKGEQDNLNQMIKFDNKAEIKFEDNDTSNITDEDLEKESLNSKKYQD